MIIGFKYTHEIIDYLNKLKTELDDALDTPVDITERSLKHYLLMKLIKIGDYFYID